METTYLAAAGLGLALIVGQFFLSLFGLGSEHDLDHEASGDHGHESGWLFGVLTFRAIASAIAFFGLGGLSALSFGLDSTSALGVALGCGALALYLVALVMRGLARLKADGTVKPEDAVGCRGTVYLRIPALQHGPGKVQLTVRNRTVEYAAVTRGAELLTGTPVRVVAVVNPGTVEVEAA